MKRTGAVVSHTTRLLRLFPFVCLLPVLAAADCQSLWNDGRSSLANRQFKQAVAQLQVAAAACENEPEVTLDLARAYLLSEDLSAAQDTLRGLLSLHPRLSQAWKLRGDAYYLAGKDEQAIDAFQKAIAADASNEDALYALGRVYYQQSRPEQAKTQFEKVIALNPKSYRAHDNLALCLQALNQDDEALRHYLTALDLVHKDHPEYDWVYANLAEFMMKRGDYRRAFDLAVEAAQRNSGSGRNCYLAAKALSKLDKQDISVRWLQRAIQLEPEYPEPHYLLAQIYRKQGKAAEASTEFERFRVLRAKVPSRLR